MRALSFLGLTGVVSACVLASLSPAAAQETAAAAPAAQGPPACVWNATPEAVRGAMLANAPRGELINQIDEAGVHAIADACSLEWSNDTQRLILYTLMANTLLTWGTDQFKTQHNIEAAGLEDIWRRVSPEDRAAFGTVLDDGAKLDEPMQHLRATCDDLHLCDDAANMPLLAYVSGRALLERLNTSGLN